MSPIRLASNNLAETYLQLALATPGTRIEHREGFVAALGSFDHPICNLAVQLDLNPRTAAELYQLATTRAAFNVYVTPSDEPQHCGALLRAAGFDAVYGMVMMSIPPLQEEESEPQMIMRQAGSAMERREVAQFMMRQFFPRHAMASQERLALSTAATDLQMWYVGDERGPICAAMLSETPDTIGLYNLCVSAGERGHGIGSQIVDWVRRKVKKQIVLQCDVILEDWYERLGFETIGDLTVYAIRKSG